VSAVGVGFPVLSDATAASWSSPSFPDWRDVPLRRLLQRGVAVPLILENDANVAALGRPGSGRGAASGGCW
jgi:predicted NBD/HSP70 family sugar kinase